MNRTTITTAIAAAVLLLATAAHAASYKCKDANGDWSEEACPDAKQHQAQHYDANRQNTFNRHQLPTVGMSWGDLMSLDPPWSKPDLKRGSSKDGRYTEEWVYKTNGVETTHIFLEDSHITSITH